MTSDDFLCSIKRIQFTPFNIAFDVGWYYITKCFIKRDGLDLASA